MSWRIRCMWRGISRMAMWMWRIWCWRGSRCWRLMGLRRYKYRLIRSRIVRRLILIILRHCMIRPRLGHRMASFFCGLPKNPWLTSLRHLRYGPRYLSTTASPNSLRSSLLLEAKSTPKTSAHKPPTKSTPTSTSTNSSTPSIYQGFIGAPISKWKKIL